MAGAADVGSARGFGIVPPQCQRVLLLEQRVRGTKETQLRAACLQSLLLGWFWTSDLKPVPVFPLHHGSVATTSLLLGSVGDAWWAELEEEHLKMKYLASAALSRLDFKQGTSSVTPAYACPGWQIDARWVLSGQGGLQQLPPAPVKLQQHTERGKAGLLESPEEERC